MARLRYNGLTATLGGSGLTTSATAVTFGAALTYNGAAATAVPTISSPDYIPLTILDSSGNVSEIVSLTAYTSGATTGTISRAQEGTTGVAHSSGDKVVHGPTALDFPGDRRWNPGLSEAVVDEFNAGSIDSAWVRVDGTGAPAGSQTWTQAGDVLSAKNTGGDAGNTLHALVRPFGTSMATGDAFVTAVDLFGEAGAAIPVCGIILADGTTFGSGNQIAALSFFNTDATTGNLDVHAHKFTGYNTDGGIAGNFKVRLGLTYLRLVKLASNTWRADASPNGIDWLLGPATLTLAFTPTHVGLVASSFGSAAKFVASYEFLRRVSGVS